MFVCYSQSVVGWVIVIIDLNDLSHTEIHRESGARDLLLTSKALIERFEIFVAQLGDQNVGLVDGVLRRQGEHQLVDDLELGRIQNSAYLFSSKRQETKKITEKRTKRQVSRISSTKA